MKRIAYLLLIEDNDLDAMITQKVLQRTGLVDKITWVENGQQALEQLQRDMQNSQCVPDLILMDLDMPVMSGLELLSQLRVTSYLSYLVERIVVLTSSQHEQDQNALKAFMIRDLLVKPLTTTQFQPFLSI